MSDATFWNGMAERYSRRPVQDPETYDYTLGRVRAYLGPEDRVLEIGAGTGTTALKLADAAGRIVASDYSDAMIAIARRKATDQGAQNVSFDVAPAEAPPAGPFDAVMTFNLLHLVSDLDTALAAMAAQIRPGGLFITKTPCLAGREAGWKVRLMLRALPLMQWAGKAPRVNRFDTATLDTAIERAGLDIVETANHSETPPSRFVVARKPG